MRSPHASHDILQPHATMPRLCTLSNSTAHQILLSKHEEISCVQQAADLAEAHLMVLTSLHRQLIVAGLPEPQEHSQRD